jgi:hypothetical protein
VSSASRPVPDAIELYWIPLGAGTGGACVRFSGWVFEAMSAAQRHRQRCSLFHSALKVFREGQQFTIEMAPEWSGGRGDHGAVAHGPVGSPVLGRSRLFRYEVRCWRDGVIPDLAAAATPLTVTTDAVRTQQLLELTPTFPTRTWGRDEGRFGEMWNSNSLISWLLASSGHDLTALACPAGGRAPGWSAGVAAARGARSVGPEN